MEHIYCCACGVETPTSSENMRFGRIFQCPVCKEVRAHVYPQGGGSAWILVRPEDIEFYNLLKTDDEDED